MHICDAIAFRSLALRCAKAMITQMGFHAMPSGTRRQGCVTQLVNPLSALSLIAAHGIPHVRAGWTLPGRRPGPRPVVAAAPRPGHPGWTLRVSPVTDQAGPRGAGPAWRAPAGRVPARTDARPSRVPALTLLSVSVCSSSSSSSSACWRGRRGARGPFARWPRGCPGTSGGRNPAGRPPRPRAASRPARRPASVPVTRAGPGPMRPGQPLQPNAAPHSPRRAVITAPFMCGPAWPQCTCSAHFPYHGFHGVIR